MFKWRIALLLCALLATAMAVGVATANAGGGNSANAKLCQKGGWMILQGSDGTQFNSQDECVSFGAHGGTLIPKPPCTAGSENFSEDAEFSQPTTFSGGTIDTAYGNLNNDTGNVRVQGSSWNGGFAAGTHLLFTGDGTPTFQLTFSEPVDSIQLDAQQDGALAVTLTAFDAANQQVGTDSAASTLDVATLEVTSASDNIAYFTISSGLPAGQGGDGVGFSNIVWGCAS